MGTVDSASCALTGKLPSEQTSYHELGLDYFDRYRAERLKRRSLAQLQRLGYQVTLTPLQTAA